MYYCRTHGEPLVHDTMRAMYRCPEYPICKTGVSDEYIARRATPNDEKLLAEWERELHWAGFMHHASWLEPRG